ncbi:MAG TPA: preprotein translocase subunit SecG [bacterium]
MYYVILAVHVLVCVLLIVIILVQGGRGGLGEALGGSGSQSLFGGGTNVVIAKVTAVGGAVFMATCLTLALLSAARGRSVIERVPATLPDVFPAALPQADAQRLPAPPASAQPEPEAAAPEGTPEPAGTLTPE